MRKGWMFFEDMIPQQVYEGLLAWLSGCDLLVGVLRFHVYQPWNEDWNTLLAIGLVAPLISLEDLSSQHFCGYIPATSNSTSFKRSAGGRGQQDQTWLLWSASQSWQRILGNFLGATKSE